MRTEAEERASLEAEAHHELTLAIASVQFRLKFLVDWESIWVFEAYAVLGAGRSICVSTLIAFALIPPAQAQAQELIDVAALEAQVEAAAELAQLPAEPDWGVPDLSNSLPAVTQDAPEVPPAPAEVEQAPPEPRYHARGAQYHAEYQGSEDSPESPPVANNPSPATAEEPAEPAPEPPAQRVSVETPPPEARPEAVPAATSAPTIWIWVWNWTWTQANDERYRNSSDQYRTDRILPDQNVTRIIEKIAPQIPVQIGVQTGSDITGEIMEKLKPEVMQIPLASPAALKPTTPVAGYRAPLTLKAGTVKPRRAASARRPLAVARPPVTSLELATLGPPTLSRAEAAPAPRHARRAGKAPRARRASRPAPTLPLPSERITDGTSASGVSGGILLKSFAVLIASMVLAALAPGRRLRLPSSRWRGLLGTRTDPPG
jgi:hypothetical protein